MNVIAPKKFINRIKNRKEKLKAEGIEPTIENLNKQFVEELKRKLKEVNNG